MRDKVMKALVLFIIGVVSGVGIWGVNEVTHEQIAENELNREKGFYKDLFSLDINEEITFTTDEISDGFYEIIISNDDGVVGYVYKGEEVNNYGDITVLVGIKDSKLENVIISSTTNTPNYSNKIISEYLSPFSGQGTETVSFDAKTGASYTYGSVSKVVVEATEYYNTERGNE